MGKSWKDKGRKDKWDRYEGNKNNNKKSRKKWDNEGDKRSKWEVYEDYGESY